MIIALTLTLAEWVIYLGAFSSFWLVAMLYLIEVDT